MVTVVYVSEADSTLYTKEQAEELTQQLATEIATEGYHVVGTSTIKYQESSLYFLIVAYEDELGGMEE